MLCQGVWFTKSGQRVGLGRSFSCSIDTFMLEDLIFFGREPEVLVFVDSWTTTNRLSRGGARVWSSRWFLDLETTIFEFLDRFYLLIPIFRLIRLRFHFSGVGRGRGRSFDFRIQDHDFWIRRTEFGLDANFHTDPTIPSFWRGGAWAWSILWFLGLGTTFFVISVSNLFRVPNFSVIRRSEPIFLILSNGY